MNGRLLTTREVGLRLGVSSETVLRWIESRGLPVIRLTSRALRYDEGELDHWLAQRTSGRADGDDEECDQPDAPSARREDTATLRPVTNPGRPPFGTATNEED